MKLIDKFLPSDYNDRISKRIKPAKPLSPDHVFEEMFCNLPGPAAWLFKLRDALVKPLGLQGGEGFRNLVSERNDEEIILSKKDKHLCFWVSIYCSLPEDGWQEASVTTVVKYNNLPGRHWCAAVDANVPPQDEALEIQMVLPAFSSDKFRE